MEKKLRPKVHFTPQKGWMNDPNAPVFFKGEYHLFYQHDPDALVWDTMHWGHAKSKDLLHWEHHPIALFPDEQGVIYSGSAWVDEKNESGFGKNDEPVLLLFYTSHHMQTKREMQCLAYTTDGEHFTKYEKNPIIPGKEHTPARDPQVLKNPILGGYSLILTRETVVEFYHSTDFVSWEKTGEFALPEYALRGMIECPCIFTTKASDGVEKTVLMLSMDVSESEFSKFPKEAVAHKRTMQYFVGTFDGKEFKVDEQQKEVLLVDYGPDFYAGTIFANVSDTILIAWLGDFSEGAHATPTEKEGFRGIQCLPRKLTVRKTENGYRLHHAFWKVPQDEVDYRKTQNEELLIDGCVTEILREDGFLPLTSYTPIEREG
ncbi:MAG: glycoside hydrolase family 32 protein [Clostridiales bacterium]|nr:glycoside hydrolase family 32 protein [Clostridiales bacterium]